VRPVRLTMQAFGPYKNVQTLDFGELQHNRLFLIHGTTGAGKTTILDAMCYALYGDTSGGERTGSEMRCKSADPALPTMVVFDFALGSRFFRALREPQQMNAAKRGNKDSLVNNAGSVKLWEIDESGGEMSVLASGVREAKDRVESLVGFSSSQFRQVVVLPQGKFRELLTSGSDERAKILSQLFRTDRYAAMERALAERAKSVTGKRAALSIQRSTILDDIENDEALEALTRVATESVVATKKSAKAAEKAAREATTAFEVAKSQAKALEDLAAAREVLAALEAQKPQIAELEARVSECEKSLKVQPLLENADIASDDLAETNVLLEAAQVELEGAKVEETIAAKEFASEEKRGTAREQAQENVRQLDAMRSKFAEWQAADSLRLSTEEQLETAEATVLSAKEGVAEAQQALERAKAGGDEVKDAAHRLEKLKSLLDQDSDSLGRLERLAVAREGLAVAHDALVVAQAAAKAASQGFESAQAEHARVEQAWREGRAASLAQELTEGEPCPVCGSKHHPAPATTAREADDAALEAARVSLSQARAGLDAANAAGAASESAKATAAERVATLEQEVGTADAFDEVRERVTNQTVEIASLQATVTAVGDPRESLANAKERLAAAESVLTQATKSEKSASKEFTAASTTVDMLAKVIPEKLRSEQALEAALSAATSQRDALDAALAAAKASVQSAKEARIAAQRDLKAATDSAAKARKRSESASKVAAAALKTHGFDDTATCEAAIMSPEELMATESNITAHRESLVGTKAQIAQAEKAAVAKPGTVNVDTLNAQAAAANEAHTHAVETRTQAEDHLKSLLEVRERLDQVDADNKKVDEEWEVVGVLAAVANGQSQGAKVSFQRWVLGTYLDQVLYAATKRLLSMSEGRYRMERQSDITNRRRISGLDLAVYDTWSNTARSATTLSGGESFLAALALALGLAETVQEQAGGTRLDTVFVDEGFGSLDQEALESAMKALMELQDTGRLVGVISHVQELRQAIDARLVVSGGRGGARAEFVVG